ncbi:cell division protein FtsQ [Edaphobacter modestus]|uniref:Cell division protein FtsQ n=2 Tax=Edaphobacter modestus TaxID=388466 RepID=A0A4Q7Z050_9BACT|nr:cell division protein FtsQ [Edaphobacter modestus]
MMAREFTDYEDEFEDDALPARRRQNGVRVKLRGGLPRSRGGKFAAVAAVLTVAGLCAALWMLARNAILHDERFMISSATAIETEGNAHVSRGQLVSLFGEDIERNIFRVPLTERKAELEELPWVAHATVMRLLPNRLRVAVTERTPVAFVRQGNRIGLVDTSGVLLDMPTDARGKMHYSFPVVMGLEAKDPLSLRAARMKLYERFTSDLDGGGEKISEKLSEVDLSSPEDVRAVVQDKGGEVMVHFGEDDFLDRYKKFEEHLPEWRRLYPHLASVDMRYERQVVLEMQPGTAAPVVGEQQAPGTDVAKPAIASAAGGSPHDKGAVSSRTAAGTHGAPKSKAVAKPVAKGKKPAAKKSAAAKPGAPVRRGVTETKSSAPPAPMLKADGESFWVHPKRSATEAGPGSSIEVKYHPPQVAHS